MALRVLVVDDSPFARTQLKQLLVSHGHQVVGEAASAAQALELHAKVPVDVVTMDLNMPGTTGLEAIVALREKSPACRIILVTAAKDESVVGDMAGMNVPVVLKPVKWPDLERALAG